MAMRLVKFLQVVVRSFLDHHSGLHAAGLTYFTLMAIVPMLCLLMVCAKVCGAGDFARRQITGYVDAFIESVEASAAPAGAPAVEAAPTTPEDKEKAERREAQHIVAMQLREFVDPLFDRIDKFDIRTFGWLGFAMLMWTVVSTLGQIEMSLNDVWEVDRPRAFWKRCIVYLSVAGVVPLLLAAALSLPVLRLVNQVLTATVGASAYTRWVGDALMAGLGSRLCSFMVTASFATLGFACIHAFMPNRRVKLLPAFGGGLVTAGLLTGWIKLCTAAQVGIGRISVFYGSFATPVILLVWIYTSWQIVLLGASFTYAFQNLSNVDAAGDGGRADG